MAWIRGWWVEVGVRDAGVADADGFAARKGTGKGARTGWRCDVGDGSGIRVWFGSHTEEEFDVCLALGVLIGVRRGVDNKLAGDGDAVGGAAGADYAAAFTGWRVSID